MVTSSYEWKILKWDEKPQTNKKYNHALAQGDHGIYMFPNTSLLNTQFVWSMARITKEDS